MHWSGSGASVAIGPLTPIATALEFMKKLLLGCLLSVSLCAVVYWLTRVPASPEPGPGYLDMHVHTGCMGFGDNECFVSDDIRNSFKFKFYLRAFDTNEQELIKHGDDIVIAKLSEKIAASRWVDQAVVLALDGVIDPNGQVDRARTQVYTPSDYVRDATAGYDNLLYGASINPYRTDALIRLEAAKADGAVLLKWIPCIMDIDPADPRLEPFYRKLVELDLPLLSHAGQERSFATSVDELCDPVRLRLPLDLGVTVIAAHIATTGNNHGVANFERLLPMFTEYPNLYTDISSLTQVNKLGYLNTALLQESLTERMVFGSDWPLQMFPLVSPWYQGDALSVGEVKHILRIDNQWDRDVMLKKFMGVPEEVFERSRTLLLDE